MEQTVVAEYGKAIDGIHRELSPDQQIAIREAAKSTAFDVAKNILAGDFGNHLRQKVQEILETLLPDLLKDPKLVVNIQAIASDTISERAAFVCSGENVDKNGRYTGVRKKMEEILTALIEKELVPKALSNEEFVEKALGSISENANARVSFLVSEDNILDSGKRGPTRERFELAVSKHVKEVLIPKALKGENIGKLLEEVLTDLTEEYVCLLYTSPSPRDQRGSRMPSSA